MVDDVAAVPDPRTTTADVRSWFDRASGWIVAGALAMGALLAAQFILYNARFGFASWSNVLVWGGYAIIAHGLAGLAAAALVRALGIWVQAFADRSSASPNAVVAPEREPRSEPGDSPAAAAARASDEELEGARRLIDAGEWDAADARVDDLTTEHPDDRRAERLAERLRRAKRETAERWFEQLRAARDVNDPVRVLELYERIPPVHDEEGRKTLDQDLAGWFLSLVHRRLRGGGIQLEIVTLVERVSESFGHTAQGASLRASLPTLRRSVGLCPRCGRPYAGAADACPICLAGKTAAAPAAPEPEPDPADIDGPPTENRDAEWFVEGDDEDF